MKQKPNVWVVKTRVLKEDGSNGWHWRAYLTGDNCAYAEDDVAENWGGDMWIGSATSRQFLRDEVVRGDVMFCYQTDTRELLAVTRMASDGKEDVEGSGVFSCFDIDPPNKAFVLDPSLTIPELYRSGCRPDIFGSRGRGTVLPIDQKAFDGILRAITRKSTTQGRKLRAWLRAAGLKV